MLNPVRRLAPSVCAGGVVGLAIGCIDLAVSGALGHWAALGWTEVAVVALLASGLLTGLGAIAGTVFGASALAVHHEPGLADSKAGRFWAAGWDSLTVALAIAVTGMAWMLDSTTERPSKAWVPLGATLGSAAVAGAIVLWASLRTRSFFRYRVLLRIALTLLLGYEVFYAAYKGSRHGVTGNMHAAALLWLIFAALLSREACLRAPRSSGRAGVLLAIGMLGLNLACPFAFAGSRHAIRLALQERTTTAYRALEILPRLGATQARALATELSNECRRPPPLAPSDVSCEPLPQSESPARGIVVVIVDALRADRVGAARHGLPSLTPNIDLLASHSVSFEAAHATHPGTTWSVPSLVTGRYALAAEGDPTAHLWLGGYLRGFGIRTIALSAHGNLRAAFRDFDRYDGRVEPERLPGGRTALSSPPMTELALATLEELEAQRFFLVVHYLDPHAHYVENENFSFGSGESARYDGEVAFTDLWLGKLLTRLNELPDVAVIITGDHGEELWDHHYVRHLYRLYEESTRVPLVIHTPGSSQAKRIRCPVSLAGVLPTALDVLGVPVPQPSTPPPFTRLRGTSEPVFLETPDGELRGIVHGRQKLIQNTKNGLLELYDLERDPGERRNRVDSGPPELLPLFCRLEDHFQGPAHAR